ncbi:hypothetical protein QQP08_021103 [Theobroma cacao]|nr:hypothetical protein QQP08_021103 [Theobroma cacao]
MCKWEAAACVGCQLLLNAPPCDVCNRPLHYLGLPLLFNSLWWWDTSLGPPTIPFLFQLGFELLLGFVAEGFSRAQDRSIAWLKTNT